MSEHSIEAAEQVYTNLLMHHMAYGVFAIHQQTLMLS